MTDVQPYALGQQPSEPAAAIGGLEKLGDRLAKRLRGLIEPYSGGRPIVTAKPIDNTMFMMWDACVPTFVSLSLYRLHPIKGTVTLRIDAELISLLVDRFYGGHGPRTTIERREFTPAETRLVARLSEQMIAALVDCWAEIMPIEPVLMGRESNVTMAEIMPGEADIVVQAFEINLGDKDHRLVEVIYPRDGFAGLEIGGADKNGSQRADVSAPVDPVWQARLGNRLDDIRLPARTVLARPNLKIS